MIWRTQYRAIMLIILIIIVVMAVYNRDLEILKIALSIQVILHIVLLIIHYVLILFGEQLFYSTRIDKKGKKKF